MAVYQQAFRHSSASKKIKDNLKDSNERLEFLGDAILGAVIADYLFRQYPFKDEGFLTQMRSRIVNRNQLNQIALRFGFDKLIKAENTQITKGSLPGDAFEAFIGALYIDKGYLKTKVFIIKRLLKIHIDVQFLEENDTDYKSKIVNLCAKDKKKIAFNLVNVLSLGKEKVYTVELEINGKIVSRAEHRSKRRAEQMASFHALENKLN